ncbi:class I SAM-dependent methyltransferase [soil metagenome]
MSRSAARIDAFTAAYYAAKLAAHGPTPKGVDWKDRASHILRHRQFLRLFEKDPAASVIDLGCGFGDFLPFLREAGLAGPYLGYDIAPEMVAEARRLHGEAPDRAWRLGSPAPDSGDFAVASGIFNVRGQIAPSAWSRHVRRTLDVLAAAARRGFGANFLSLASDPEKRRADLHYADPARMLAYCQKRYGRSVALLHDYGLYEFTLLVRRP